MVQVLSGRVTAGFAGPVVVFIIGFRINRLLRPDKWVPVARAMGPMIRELTLDPDSGFLGSETMLLPPRALGLIQYWRDFDRLEAYARARDRNHWPAWTAFNRRVGADGTVGIFHETYAVEAGRYETIYANMPPFGLGRIVAPVPASGSRNAARDRMRTGGGG